MFFFDFPADIQALLNSFWWQINFLLLVILIILGYLSIKKTVWAAGLTIILLPTYLFRSKFGFLPFTFLELCILTTFGGWLINKVWLNRATFFPTFRSTAWPIILVIVSATISIFFSPSLTAGLGIWKAYFIEPILFFFVLLDLAKDKKNKTTILWALGISTLAISLLAIFQKFTAFGIAQPAWIPTDQRRVTSLFTSPNAVGLYLAPIMLIYLGWLLENLKSKILSLKNLFIVLILILSLLAIIFTVSQGTWLGLLAGLIFFSFIGFSKKWTAAMVLIAILIILAVPVTRDKILPSILFKDTSGQNRIILWQMSKDYLLSSPVHFIFGAGQTGFAEIQNDRREPLKMEPLLYPHNIFLNFWLEIGLLGLMAFIWTIILFFSKGFNTLWTNHNSLIQIGIMSAMTCLIIHGLIDVPYFKNDLAVLFWILVALI